MTNPTETQPVPLAVGVALVVNAVVAIAGARFGFSGGEVAGLQSAVLALAGAWAWRHVYSPATVAEMTAPKPTKKAAKKG